MRGNDGRLCEVDNGPQREVTTKTDITLVTCLVKGSLNMKYAIYVWVHETPLQMQMTC